MNQFRYKLAQFLYGRNGNDALGYALMVLCLIVLAVNFFLNILWLTILGYLVIFVMFFRVFSKNLARRRRENEVFLRLYNPGKAHVKQAVRRVRDIRKYRYRTCPSCKVTMRLPIKRGKNAVVCPKCKTKVNVRVWF